MISIPRIRDCMIYVPNHTKTNLLNRVFRATQYTIPKRLSPYQGIPAMRVFHSMLPWLHDTRSYSCQSWTNSFNRVFPVTPCVMSLTSYHLLYSCFPSHAFRAAWYAFLIMRRQICPTVSSRQRIDDVC